ncbi:MAG: hypothetical protein ACE5Z5_10340, partial [Candidatus Bathyarchaeia archaeon]
LRWFAKSGPTPTLIGGWAVWMYNSYLGSVDIDIVGPGLEGSFDLVIERYEQIHRYERVRRNLLGLEYVYRKPVLRGSRLVGYVEIDACSFETDTGRFHEDTEKSLPYRLCADPKLVREITLDRDAVCFIPKKGLLFLYKLKAERDRSYDLRIRGAIMSVERRSWLEAKLSKDRSDLIALLDPQPKKRAVMEEFDYELVKGTVENRGLGFVYESISALPNRTEAIRRYSAYKKVNPREIERWIEPLMPEQP